MQISYSSQFSTRRPSHAAPDYATGKGTRTHGSLPESHFFTGYKSNLGGSLSYYIVLFLTFLWPCLLILLIADYYQIFREVGVINPLFLNQNTIAKVFMFIWNCSLVWFFVLKICETRIASYFRLECSLEDAMVIQIEQEQKMNTNLGDESTVVRWAHSVEVFCAKLFR